MTEHNLVLSDDEREAVYLLGETLIPEGGSGPSADQAGLAAVFIDEFLELRPDLIEPVRALIADADKQDPRGWCERLQLADPAAFERLTFVIAGAYLLSPKARSWLDYPGQTGEPQDGSPQQEYADGGLLTPVRERGPIYRPTNYREQVAS